MVEGKSIEVSREIAVENFVRETPTFLAKNEQLASSASRTMAEEDPDNASFPPVEARGLTGDTVILEGCRAVGSIMARLAIRRDRLANQVIVMDPHGRKMAARENVIPMVQFVIVNEEDAVVDIASTRLNLRLHSQQSDHPGCARLLEVLKTLDRRDDNAMTAESVLLCDIMSLHEGEWRTSVETLMQVGVSAGPAFLKAASVGFADGVAFLLSVQPALIGDLLLAARATCDRAQTYGNAALHLAASEGHVDVVTQLLAAGGHIEHVDRGGNTALMLASRSGHADVVRTLIAAGGNVEHENGCSSTALIIAARFGHGSVVAELIAAGVNVEHTNSYGDTALFESIWCHDVLVQLIAAGVKVDHINLDGETVLTIASRDGENELISKLVAAETRVDPRTADPALIRHDDTIAILLAAGAQVNYVNSDGETALTLTCKQSVRAPRPQPVETVAKLLAAGAAVEHANSAGDTALTLAASRGYDSVVEKLLLAGAVDHANLAGDTALTLATSRGHTSVVGQLASADQE